MKITALFLAAALFWVIQSASAQESIEVTNVEQEIIAKELEKEAGDPKHDPQTRSLLLKVSNAFKSSKEEIEITVKADDCVDCSRPQKRRHILNKIGRKLGKAAAWVSTTTAKPFMVAAGFVKGAVEKESKNQELVALYQFFLNHEEEFNSLYLEAGTPEEMLELMLVKMEEITERKSRLIIKDLLSSLGVQKEVPADLADFELSAEELASIDPEKVDVSFINEHAEYKELRPLLGDVKQEEIMDIIMSGYLNRAISFDNYKATVPTLGESIGAVVGQLFVPKLALGIVSGTLSNLYFTPVLAANIGTGVSAAICMKQENKEKLKTDTELRSFCSYVVNRSAYELGRSRAKGYVGGKKFHKKIKDKIQRMKDKRAEKRRQKELELQNNESKPEDETTVPTDLEENKETHILPELS